MCKKALKSRYIFSFLIIITILFSACTADTTTQAAPESTLSAIAQTVELTSITTHAPVTAKLSAQSIAGPLTVHFLDVGQADSILIQLPNDEIMLIDAGNNEDAKFIISYLQTAGISKIDYLIGTHPHEDHIGALDNIIDTFEIERIYMPKAATTTKTFEDVLSAIENKGLTINTAKSGVGLFNYSNLQADFLAPASDTYADLNNYSAVLKLTYGDTSFLFTGDAETLSEDEILSANLKSDVLKVGHHGSNSSTSDRFLLAVNPVYAIISCGLNNSYGHPDETVVDRLYQNNISVYRTDLQGTIVITSDGETISIHADAAERMIATPAATPKPAAIQTAAPAPTATPAPTKALEPAQSPEPVAITVYVTKTGEKYHTSNCSYLSKSKISIDLDKAKSEGYTPCSRCNPPK